LAMVVVVTRTSSQHQLGVTKIFIGACGQSILTPW